MIAATSHQVLNTAFCSLAASSLLGWQKANPELSANSLSSETAFRLVVGWDRDPPLTRTDSFQGLQSFLRNLESERIRIGNEDKEVPDWLGTSKDHFEHMVTGIRTLFDVNYLKVSERHLILAATGEEASLVAADHLMSHNLLPRDAQLGELMQLSLNPNPEEPDRALQRCQVLQDAVIAEIRPRFPFAEALSHNFKNGRLVTVSIPLDKVSPPQLRSFFTSEEGRFVTELRLTSSVKTWLNLHSNDLGVEGARIIREWALRRKVTVRL